MHTHTDRPIGKGSFHDAKHPRKIVSTLGNCTQADYVLLEDLSDGYVLHFYMILQDVQFGIGPTD